jgi:hypothetical protein
VSNGQSTVALKGEIVLPAADASVDTNAPDASTDAGAAPSCTMTVTGAYSTRTLAGQAQVFVSSTPPYILGCSVKADGLLVWGSSGGYAEIGGTSWCASGCSIEYTGQCTGTAIRNDGTVGGRFVGSFECPDEVAPDGTHLAVSANLDAIIDKPPE